VDEAASEQIRIESPTLRGEGLKNSYLKLKIIEERESAISKWYW